ncbi:P-loop containing nucleoside triphosphate hydrolase protein [Polychytrium aggregatum]|uniref:P-loop containing nucleoside triphosphate hydrolase protein n=1 Tax=Polychytrium aggregatum TaxID=110093 RepID=UPI0022FEFA41|nr:P-loop containing nucleoside triphosphate hydrolase protein [Polychytrium aggregatum]KAI9208345.1 P-loop containing nucleoside triphosphate hydrolase protein [Polychytrium aggregatum]
MTPGRHPSVAEKPKAEVVADDTIATPDPAQRPLRSRTAWSIWTISWLNPLYKLGSKRPLQPEDLFQLDHEQKSSVLVLQFEEHWNRALQSGKAPSVLGIVIRLLGWKYFSVGLLKFVADSSIAFCPFLMQGLIQSVVQSQANNGQNPPPLANTYLISLGFLLLTSLSSICNMFLGQVSIEYATAIKGVLTTVIYRKTLKLSGKSRQEFHGGVVVNMVSTDCTRIENSIQQFHLIWTFPLWLSVTTVVLYLTIGVAGLAGIAILLVFVPIQAIMIKALVKLRTSTAKITDQRVKFTQEIVSGIRVVKFFGWERSFIGKILDIRDWELKLVVRASLIRAVFSGLGFALPAIASAVTLLVYGSISPVFNATSVFSALALFNQLRQPIMWIPVMLGTLMDGMVGFRRIQRFMDAAEIESQIQYNPDGKLAVEINGAHFEWEVPLETPVSPEKLAKPKEEKESFKHTDAIGFDTHGSEVDLLVPGSIFSLKSLDLAVPRGSLVAIVGPVGSGKSSLLSAIIGELKCTSGHITLGGSIGYCPQQAWIVNSSVEENITFGSAYDRVRYERVISDCALARDLEILPDGDQTEIGERGVNLSGGQKQRISIARTVYADSDIVLLDDPLSAVDAHVGRYIFERCIRAALNQKTRLFVTHQLHLVPQCDHVILMAHGQIQEQGSFADLMALDGEFARLMTSYGGIDSVGGDESSDDDSLEIDDSLDRHQAETMPSIETLAESEVPSKHATLSNEKEANARTEKVVRHEMKRTRDQMQQEERLTGAVQTKVFLSYLKACGSVSFIAVLAFSLIFTQVTRLSNDLWLVSWSQLLYPDLPRADYMGIFAGLGLLQSCALLLYSCLVAIGSIQSAKNLHGLALNGVFGSAIRFFDTTPIGRIINRFARDQDSIDTAIGDAARLLFYSILTLISSFLVIIYFTKAWFLVVLVPMMVLYFFIQRLYRTSTRELKRIESLTRSPLYAHISESMSGLSTIRAYKDESRFIEKTEALIDLNLSPALLMYSGQKWIQIRLEMIGNLMVYSMTLFAAIFRATVSASQIGLSISYLLQLTSLLNMCIFQAAELDIQLNSVERIVHYSSLEPEERLVATNLHVREPRIRTVESEAEPHTPDISPEMDAEIQDSALTIPAATATAGPVKKPRIRPLRSWPAQGLIEFRDVQMRYAADLPLVLKGVMLRVEPKQKIGVVGRTGSGKSSLVFSLFRMTELSGGAIVIDGIDTAQLTLHDLRSRIGIIPQDPVLFSGTIRSNLDPFQEHSDARIWDALERSGMKSAIMATDDRLDSKVTDNGENWSVGQRQLICLARAILKRPKIVVLDECTANVDYESDQLIQKSIREDFENSTVLTIAHRLNTIIDYDKILVMDQGVVAEFDTPAALLLDRGIEQSIFARMVEDSGPSNAALLKGLVRRGREGCPQQISPA